MIGLLKTYIAQFALPVSLVGLLAVSAFAGIQTWRLGNAQDELAAAEGRHQTALAEISRVSRETEARRLAEAAERQKSHIEIDRNRYKELQDAKTERDNLSAGISSGKYRVYVRAHCPAPSAVSAPGDSSGVDSGARAELDREAGQSFLDIRESAKRHESKLAACQEALRAELSR